MKNPKRTLSKLDNKGIVNPPLATPEEMPSHPKLAQEIIVPIKIEILKPSEEGENWNEKLPKEGYDPEYPNMPTSSGTLL